MSIHNFIPELWNETLIEEMQTVHVFGRVCRCKIDAPITKKGDTVHITGIGDIDFFDYDGTDMDLQELDDAGLIMHIDQAKAFNFMVDDVDAFQANGDVMKQATQKAAYKRKNIADKYLNGILKAGAGLSTETQSAMTTTLIISSVAEMALALDEKDVPSESQWIIIPMWANTKLVLAGIVHAQDLKGNINGFVSNILGPDLYKSNNVGAEAPLAGSYGAAAYAEQIIKTVAYQPEKTFKDALKGLHVYGSKVVKPNELVLGDWTESMETKI
jgi:hypothetical protein